MDNRIVDAAGITTTAIAMPTFLLDIPFDKLYAVSSGILSLAWLCLKIYNELKALKQQP